MIRPLKVCVLALPLLIVSTAPAAADVKTRDKTQVKLEGMLGRMAGMFGGKAVREGIVQTHAVKGDRKAEMTDTSGRIVDLKEEKVYELDLKDKSYTVTTFDELRRRMKEAQERAERDTPKEEQPQQQQDPDKPAKEVEVDFDVKETGQRKSVAGYDAREVVMTVTVREKGRALEESGGLVMTANSWIGPAIPAMKELVDFELRYWKAIAPEASGLSAEQMAALMAMYPMLKNAMERMRAESTKLEGTALATTMMFEAVKSKEQAAQQAEQKSGGGLGGMLARRMMKKEDKPRATIFTTTHEMLEVSQSVQPSDLELPPGLKEKR